MDIFLTIMKFKVKKLNVIFSTTDLVMKNGAVRIVHNNTSLSMRTKSMAIFEIYKLVSSQFKKKIN